jgi:hypothetical protein
VGVRLLCAAQAEADDDVGDHLNDVLWDGVNATPEIVALLRTAADQGEPGAAEAIARHGA